jgi:hypothetical protein
MRPDQSGPPERKHAPDGDERQVSEVHNDGRISEPDQHDSVDRRSLPLSRVDALQGKDVGMDEPRAEIVDVIIDCSDANRRAPSSGAVKLTRTSAPPGRNTSRAASGSIRSD